MSARWISAFLEAQAAERDAARNTLLAYGRDLKDFAGLAGAARRHVSSRQPRRCGSLSGGLRRRGAGRHDARAAAVIDPPVLSLRP
jgi:site-specific recombinase XerD